MCLPLILAPSLAFVVTPKLPSGATLITRHQQQDQDPGSTDGDAASVPDLCGDRVDAADRWFQINSTLREDDGIMRDCDAVVTWVGVDRDESTVVRLLQPVESRQSASDAILRSAGNQVPPRSAVEAIEATQRWSSNFVRRLNLCPWAAQSLDTQGAMRFWVLLVGEDDGEELIFDRLHRTIRMAGEHLVSIAAPASEDDPTGRIAVDPSAAISFVILARVDGNVPNPPAADFGSFYETFLYLEDRFLDECDVYWNTNGDESGGELPLGCDITIAAFHPEWKFDSSDTSAIGESCQPIDYEKRTPYPTVSIVLSSAIDSLMDERVGGADPHGSALVTKRIAEVNVQTLDGLGIEEVERLYAAEVAKCLPPGS